MSKLIEMYSVTVKESFVRGFAAVTDIDLNKPPSKPLLPKNRTVVKGEILMTVQEFVTAIGKKTTNEDIKEIQEMFLELQQVGGVHTYYATGWEVTLWKTR